MIKIGNEIIMLIEIGSILELWVFKQQMYFMDIIVDDCLWRFELQLFNFKLMKKPILVIIQS